MSSNGNELVASLIFSNLFPPEMIGSWLSNSCYGVKAATSKTMAWRSILQFFRCESMWFVRAMFEQLFRTLLWAFERHTIVHTDPGKATVGSRVGVLFQRRSRGGVLNVTGRGNTSKGCSDDLQLAPCLVTCPVAQGELHIYSKNIKNIPRNRVPERQYGAAWEQTIMGVTWCNVMQPNLYPEPMKNGSFSVWLPSLETRSRTEEWLLEVVRIGESEKGNPLWDLSTLRFFKRWAERFFR